MVVLFYGIHNGLLGHPDMQIACNGSSSHTLKWYQDITDSTLPQPVVFSLPMTVEFDKLPRQVAELPIRILMKANAEIQGSIIHVS
ncbi:MAG: hypothetical protein R6V54_03755 [Desulfobacteraceae bacterium]